MTKHRTLRRILAVAAVAALPLAAAGTDAHADGGVSWQTYAQGHGYLSSDANGSVIIVSNNPGHNWYDHQLSNGRWLEIRSGSLFNSTQQCIEINGTSYANAYDKQTSTLDLWPCSKSATSAPWNLQWNEYHSPKYPWCWNLENPATQLDISEGLIYSWNEYSACFYDNGANAPWGWF